MLRGFLKILIPCLLLALVLAAAKYMDSGAFFRRSAENPEETTSAASLEVSPAETVRETEPAQTISASTTLPRETAPPQTLPPETVPQETIPQETVPQETIPQETVPQETTRSERDENTFLLTFMGDCTFGATSSSYYAKVSFVSTVGSDYGYPFRNVIGYLETDDFTFLNLEGPLTDEGNPMPGKFIFRGPAEYVNILSENSVEAVSLSNNHTMDYGQTGYQATCQGLDQVRVGYVEKDSTRIITLDNGLKIGLYATMYTSVDEDAVTEQIRSLKQQGADVIIYAPHWGTEGSYSISQDQADLAHTAIDAGAHIVYGSHPHVLQPVEEYKNGVIYYSMGNFSFGGNTKPRDMDTALLQQEIILQEDGTVVLGERTIVPCCISSDPWNNNYQPTPYEPGSHEYDRVLKKLNGTYEGANLPLGEG